MNMKKMAIFLIFLLSISHSAILNAAEIEKEYSASGKFTRGIFNIITFPFELPVTIYKTSTEQNILAGLLYGIPAGLGRGAIRMCAGLVEFTTFPFPPYEPIIEPEFLFIEKKESD